MMSEESRLGREQIEVSYAIKQIISARLRQATATGAIPDGVVVASWVLSHRNDGDFWTVVYRPMTRTANGHICQPLERGMKRLHVIQPKRHLMTPAEERKLLAKADATEKALLILGVDGLIRQGDLLDLRHTDRQGDWLYVADPKGGQPYEVALTPRAVKALKALPATQPDIFQRYRGHPSPMHRRALVRYAMRMLCQRAHVPYGAKKGGITFHWATRRTGATRLVVQHKAPIPAVQRQGNWKHPDVLLSIYTEADRHAQRAAVLSAHVQKKRRSA